MPVWQLTEASSFCQAGTASKAPPSSQNSTSEKKTNVLSTSHHFSQGLLWRIHGMTRVRRLGPSEKRAQAASGQLCIHIPWSRPDPPMGLCCHVCCHVPPRSCPRKDLLLGGCWPLYVHYKQCKHKRRSLSSSSKRYHWCESHSCVTKWATVLGGSLRETHWV